MAQASQAIALRVHHALVGNVFPFDIVYFFKKEDEYLIPGIFPYSMVLMITKKFSELIRSTIELRKLNHAAFPLRRKDEESWKRRFKDTGVSKTPLNKVLNNYTDFVALVPTLFLAKDKQNIAPAYLHGGVKVPPRRTTTGKRKGRFTSATPSDRVNSVRSMMKKVYSARSYFLINGQKFQPLCVACPNNLSMLNGECFFGQDQCYSLLAQSTPGEFVQALKRYQEFTVEFGEPELEVEDG